MAVIGVLFGLVIGFYFHDLWNRLETIRSNAGVETSGLSYYIILAKVLGMNPKNKKWYEKQKTLVTNYLKEFFKYEWHENTELNESFNKIGNSFVELKEPKTDKEIQVWNVLLQTYGSVNSARDKNSIIGNDKLTYDEWLALSILGASLLICLFYMKTDTLLSILFTGMLSTVTLTLFLVIADLNDMSVGEETIAFEPYQMIFDAMDAPRHYLREHIETGRLHLPEDGTKYVIYDR